MRNFRVSVLATALIGCVFLAPQQARADSLMIEPLTQEKLEEMMFDSTAQGCEMKFNIFTVSLIAFREGQPVEELGGMAMAQPLFQRVYDSIRSEGVTPSIVKAMRELQSCAERFQTPQDIEEAREEAVPFEQKAMEELEPQQSRAQVLDPSAKKYLEEARKADEAKVGFFRSCGTINALGLSALDGLEKKEEQAAVEARAVAAKMDFSGTFLQSMETPEKVYISQIYSAEKEGGYERAVDTAYGFVLQCIGTRR